MKRKGTLPKKHNEMAMRQENFDAWVKGLRAKHGDNIFNWPPHAREWYRSVRITDADK